MLIRTLPATALTDHREPVSVLRGMTHLQAERYRRMMPPQGLERRDVDAEHKAIMEATLARNLRLACKLMARHLRTTMDLTPVRGS